MHLECPDPERHPERLKLWVEKTYSRRPPPLGVTIKSDGNEYDSMPPVAVPPNKGGRPPKERDQAIEFVREALKKEDCLATELCAKWEAGGGSDKTFWRAVNDMQEAGEVVADGGKGTGRQMLLHYQEPREQPEEKAHD
jgi:hypothetical protein